MKGWKRLVYVHIVHFSSLYLFKTKKNALDFGLIGYMRYKTRAVEICFQKFIHFVLISQILYPTAKVFLFLFSDKIFSRFFNIFFGFMIVCDFINL